MKTSTKRFVLSDQTKNLYGFTTITAGIDLSAFKDNPVMLYNHDYDKLIGVWVDWRIEGTQLTAAPAFDDNDPYAMKQFNKVEAGILKGASIGISPLQFDEAKSEMSASLLLEASLTPVPNNQNALAIYNAVGQQLSAEQARMYLLSIQNSNTVQFENAAFKTQPIADKKNFDYYALNAPADLEKMQISDPNKFDQLLAEKVKAIRLSHANYFEA